MTARAPVTPDVDPDSVWWWEALAQGRLQLPRCTACGKTFFPPMEGCPHCASVGFAPVDASGGGRIYSWVVVNIALDPAFADEAPYTVVCVDLDEGPRLFGRWWCDTTPEPDAAVRAVVEVVDGTPLLGFTRP